MAVSRRQILVGAAAAASVAPLLARSRAEADQPHMEAAREALKNAQHELNAATADKGGHRAKAIDLVKSAIAEVEQGIEWAKKH